ncbi:GNAT family N-acetyltransferase [Streptomyces sp. MP131-18]|uniref:GNAT family N-acetyltransferase n=1 Tax=Streptomyces sp. MP131-18 TaxID=1857892 RepID=UPI00097BBB58|nr:GNAT family N-acetyltransferase [Streptomyces sp. MP131-18]ONK15496.1 putative acetyltransferase [Streptomyces sp. MP131-18]
MSGSHLPRIRSFLADFARRQAGRTIALPGGFAVLNDALGHSHTDNQLIVDGAADPGTLPATADALLGHLPHRLITVLDERAGAACGPALLAAGYTKAVHLVMLHTGPVPQGGAAQAVGLDALRAPLVRRWRGFLPAADEEAIRQLVERRAVRHRGADTVEFIASRAPDGEAASWADLYLDPAAGVAQIEDVLTAEEHLGKGHGSAVLTTALRRAADAGCGTRFLLADEADWPRDWYERLGFTVIGRTFAFERG